MAVKIALFVISFLLMDLAILGLLDRRSLRERHEDSVKYRGIAPKIAEVIYIVFLSAFAVLTYLNGKSWFFPMLVTPMMLLLVIDEVLSIIRKSYEKFDDILHKDLHLKITLITPMVTSIGMFCIVVTLVLDFLGVYRH